MTNTNRGPSRPTLTTCLAIAFTLAACAEQAPTELGSLEPAPAAGPVTLYVSATSQDAGSLVTVSVGLALTEDGEAPGGLEGTLRYDPAQLRYHGVILEEGAAVLANEETAPAGVLPFVALGAEGLTSRAASFAFEVLSRGSVTLYLEDATAYGADGPVYDVDYVLATLAADLPDAWLAERPTLERLARHLDPEYRARDADGFEGALLTAGAGDVLMGDVIADGTINAMDVMAVMSVVNGNKVCGTNTPGPTIDCVAGNVFPGNLPGVGGPLDPCAPGVEVCGSSSDGWVTLNDGMLIQFRVNNPGSAYIVGFPSPECRFFCPPCYPDGRCPPIMP